MRHFSKQIRTWVPRATTLLFLVAACGAAQADLLTDGQMFFDPATFDRDYYSRLYLSSLATQNTLTFDAGADPVVGANVLPMLKPNEYGAGYVYSQADYDYTPNVDYYGDLTDGVLTTTINQPGLYHIRTFRASGQSDIFAVFAEFAFKEKKGRPDKSGGNKRLNPLPDADLILVENSDSTLDDSAEVWKKGGRNVQRVSSRADAVKKINDAAAAAKRKIHVEIDGHGAPAEIGTGAGEHDIPDKQIDSDSIVEFCKQIRASCNILTFQGCSVGEGAKGAQFLQTIATSIGTAGAWDSEVGVVDKSAFSVSSKAKFITKVPAPTSAGVLLMSAIFAARRRRD